MKLRNYTIDEIFEKNLLLFLPYYIMRYEKRFHEISKNPVELQFLLAEYREIQARLAKDLCENEKSALYTDLVNLIIDISNYMLDKEEELKKGVSDVMGGKVLELQSEKLIRIGKEEGENIFATLINKLFEVGRADDAALAAKDEEARKRFYKEFGLID